VVAPVFFLTSRAFSGRIQRAAERERALTGKLTSAIEESLSGQALIQAYSRQTSELRMLHATGDSWLRARMAQIRLGAIYGPAVYIVETPVTWNYSPQNITVVIGVNNTVTWVSKSISFDTITSANGLFDSGNIAPGQTYSYTFDAPGVYSYDCAYHPWMVGTVTVLPA